MPHNVVFYTASRLALGKLRRITNVAAALRDRNQNIKFSLLSNAYPRGLNEDESALYDQIKVAQPQRVTDTLISIDPDAVVVGTVAPRDLHRVEAPLCLILRHVAGDELDKFRLKQGRPWDLVVLPHSPQFWRPDIDPSFAKRIEPVGWIYRRAESKGNDIQLPRPDTESAVVLITTGGGTGQERDRGLGVELTHLITRMRQTSQRPVYFIQALGPYAGDNDFVPDVDETIRPGPELHRYFGSADLVISTAGYNTALELARSDVPVLLISTQRYTDDQEKRAEYWGKELGMYHIPGKREQTIHWMTSILSNGTRRPVVDVGPSGADRCAALVEGLLGPII